MILKVLSYWNLNKDEDELVKTGIFLKVLSYWNLNYIIGSCESGYEALKYYHIGI